MYTLQYHEKIPEDIARLPRTTKSRIKKAIQAKLTTEPYIFGKPLAASLSGARSLRVGEYRVLYIVEEKKKNVRVLLIGHRKNVYDKAEKRPS